MSLLPPILYRAPISEQVSNLLARPWVQWLQALDTRVGGPDAPTILELEAFIAALDTRIDALEATLANLVLHQGLPTIAAVSDGSGLGAIVTVSGTDTAGTISLTTVSLADRRSNSEIARVTFAAAYAASPRVQLSAANDAADALLHGRFTTHPCTVHLRQSDVTTTGFAIRVGVTRLPKEGEIYEWNYLTWG